MFNNNKGNQNNILNTLFIDKVIGNDFYNI